MKIILANPRGFCAGVQRAIEIVEQAVLVYGAPVYVKHAIVHNDYVINKLSAQGVLFIEDINAVPEGAVLVFSAHGVSKRVRKQSMDRNLIIFDATCPLVTKVHMEVMRAHRNNMEVILIGHKAHPEVVGTMGQYSQQLCANDNKNIYLVQSVEDARVIQVNQPNRLFFVTQTTFSVDETMEIVRILRDRFPNITGPRKSDICYATSNRQNALKELALKVDVIFVVGSSTSSNATRLVELALRLRKDAYLINDANNIQVEWLYGRSSVGITAGASVPDILVSEVIDKIRSCTAHIGNCVVEEMDALKESIFFNVPNIYKK